MDWIWVLIPVTALLIPIVAIFSSHQQKMAQILHGAGDRREIDALREEVSELRRQLGQQALTVDDMRTSLRSLAVKPEGGPLTDRLTQG